MTIDRINQIHSLSTAALAEFDGPSDWSLRTLPGWGGVRDTFGLSLSRLGNDSASRRAREPFDRPRSELLNCPYEEPGYL